MSGRRRIGGAAGERGARSAVPPRVVDHPVRMRQRAGANRRVTGARHGHQIRIARVLEHHALIEQRAESVPPVAVELLEIVRAQLIDDEGHEQPRRVARRGSVRRDRQDAGGKEPAAKSQERSVGA